MGELDHGAKLALRADPEGVIGRFLPGVTKAGPLPQETISAQRTVDGSYAATVDGREIVVHVEFEAEPTSSIGERAAQAACALFVATRRRVRVLLFYLHEAKDGRLPLDRFELPIGEEPAELVFRPVRLWQQDPEAALAGPVGWLPFVPLMRDASLGHVQRAVDEIGRAPGLDERTRHDLIAATHLLGTYHFARAALAAIIPREVLMQSPGYQWLVHESHKEMIEKGFQQRLGSVPKDIQEALEAADAEVLRGVTLALMTRDDDATILARVRAALGLTGS